MPLLSMRHPTGSCAISAMALGDFMALVNGRGALIPFWGHLFISLACLLYNPLSLSIFLKQVSLTTYSTWQPRAPWTVSQKALLRATEGKGGAESEELSLAGQAGMLRNCHSP